jgi:hypothetical protein
VQSKPGFQWYSIPDDNEFRSLSADITIRVHRSSRYCYINKKEGTAEGVTLKIPENVSGNRKNQTVGRE